LDLFSSIKPYQWHTGIELKDNRYLPFCILHLQVLTASTWEEIAKPRDLLGKEHCLKALSDGTLLQISASGEVSRSKDGG